MGMTLNDWERKYNLVAPRFEVTETRYTTWTPNSESHRELYYLSDYVVSTVTAGTVWLKPRSAFLDPVTMKSHCEKHNHASFYCKDGKFHEVKNLGWALRHAGNTIIEYMGFNYAPNDDWEGHFFIKFKDCTYFTDYASLYVCLGFINRPLFKGVEFRVARIELDTRPTKTLIVGSNEHKAILKASYNDAMGMALPRVG